MQISAYFYLKTWKVLASPCPQLFSLLISLLILAVRKDDDLTRFVHIMVIASFLNIDHILCQ